MEYINIPHFRDAVKFGVDKTIILSSSNVVKTIEYASRLCYNSVDKITDFSWFRYIRSRIKEGHTSVIEHSNISMISVCTPSFANKVESLLAKTNTLLTYVKDTMITAASDMVMISVTGNIRMWRDLFTTIGGLEIDSDIIDAVYVYAAYFKLWDLKLLSGLEDAISASGEIKSIHDTYKFGNFSEFFTAGLPVVKQFSPGLLFNSGVTSGNRPEVLDYVFSSGVKAVNHVLKRRRIECENDDIEIYGLNIDEPLIMGQDPEFITFVSKYKKKISSVTIEYTMPRIITQQEARHRINGISQSSQRYVSESNATFYVPETIDGDKKYNINGMELSYNDVNNIIKEMYVALQNDGVKNEDARFILSNATMSRLVVTKPMYTVDHYIKERTSKAAQREIRYVAEALKSYINSTDIVYQSYYGELPIK